MNEQMVICTVLLSLYIEEQALVGKVETFRKRGPRKYNITEEQLKHLHSIGFATSDIGKLYNVSSSTIKRRKRYINIHAHKRNDIEFWQYNLALSKEKYF